MPKDIQFILYNFPEKEGKVQVIIRDETLWCTQKAMAQLFVVDRTVVSKHLKNIFESALSIAGFSMCKILYILPRMARYMHTFPNFIILMLLSYWLSQPLQLLVSVINGLRKS